MMKYRKTAWIVCMLALVTLSTAREVVVDGQVTPHVKRGFGTRIRKLLFGQQDPDIRPFALAIGPSGQVLCTDIDLGRVLQLDDAGTIVRVIGSRRSGPELAVPVAIGCDGTGRVYVVDSERRGVVRYARGFKQAQVIIVDPGARFTGLAVSGNALYLTDAARHRVAVYGLDGAFRFAFGQRGNGPGDFNYPCGIAVWQDRVFVLDTLNYRVQVFDDGGGFIRMFGRQGDTGGDFARPKGIAVSPDGLILVSDAILDNVQIFDQEGRFLYWFGGPGTEPGQFWNPAGIVFQDGNTILVADRFNKRIQRFQIKGETP